ncbi:alpha/beta fold hydrolase [Ferrovibrio xuzhouensis]|uniref:Alpha/beta fold hydrolase n=1 Tax=Ferrovibrio xuzhouensis TaxID=1576914 RepID=A0ABV7VBX5_9PROT
MAAFLYGRQENPDGPVVLLVHGWEDDHLSWAPLIDRLVAAGYRVLAPDLPGHGRSPARLASIPVFAAGVAATAREATTLGLVSDDRPFHAVIAHSLGGTGTLLAAAEHELPARRLAILAAPNQPRLFAGAMMAILGLTPAQTAQVFTAIERLVGRSMESLYLPPKLRSLGMPGLILHSRDDRVVPLQHSRENAAAWPGARLRVLDGLGHRKLVSDADVQTGLLHFIRSDAPADAFGPPSESGRPDAA